MFLNACSAARKTGDMTVLFPKGVKRIDELPWYLLEAINQGFTILSWYENFTDEEVPPEYLWEDGTGLERWFERVKENRGLSTGGSSIPEGSEMTGNDYADVFKGLR